MTDPRNALSGGDAADRRPGAHAPSPAAPPRSSASLAAARVARAPDLRGKEVLVLGLGHFGGGFGAARWLLGQGAHVTVTDRSGPELLAAPAEALRAAGARVVLGGHEGIDFGRADLLVVNPAVPLTAPPVLAAVGRLAVTSAAMSTPYPPTAPAQPPVAAKSKPPRTFADRFARLVLVVVLVAIAGFALYTWATLNYTYSEGERVGYARKLSKKGWICKTWEGEISMTNAVGAQESVFAFTVRDPTVVEKFRALEGKHVTILYKERVGIPTSCFGDTPYHAYDVRAIK